MKRSVFRGVAAVLLMLGLGAGSASAQSDAHVGVGFKVSTLGFGVDLAIPVAPKVNIRAGGNFFSYSHTFTGNDFNVAADLKLKSIDAHLDWFPMGGGFHISPGVTIYNGNKVSGVTQFSQTQTFSIGDQDNLRSDPKNPVTGTADVTWEKVAPSLLFGWGNLVPRGHRHWGIQFEMGALYSRQPNLVLALTGNACDQSGGNCRSVTTDPQLVADVKKQNADTNSDLSVIKVYPVMSLGFGFRF